MNEEIVKKIINIINDKTDIDFNRYKINTILRRLRQRMSVKGFKCIEDYYEYLIENLDQELDILIKYFLINTSEFFRDPLYFYFFERLVKDMLHDKMEFIKILCIGCSSGEEPYSIAMILNERKNKNPQFDFHIDAFDIDPEAIMEAKSAVYMEYSMQHVPYNYLKKYFTVADNEFKLIKAYFKGNITFYLQDIFKMDSLIKGIFKYNFIFVRNILLYFKSDQTIRLFKNIINILEKDGYLILGTSEYIPNIYTPLFKQVCKGIKIFKLIK